MPIRGLFGSHIEIEPLRGQMRPVADKKDECMGSRVKQACQCSFLAERDSIFHPCICKVVIVGVRGIGREIEQGRGHRNSVPWTGDIDYFGRVARRCRRIRYRDIEHMMNRVLTIGN